MIFTEPVFIVMNDMSTILLTILAIRSRQLSHELRKRTHNDAKTSFPLTTILQKPLESLLSI